MKSNFFTRFSRQRRPFKLTRGGIVFILYTIGVGAGAINTGNNLLYLVFGLFLGLILASGVLSDLSLWGLEADLEFPLSIEAGQICAIPIRLTNRKKWLPSISVRIELSGEIRGEKISLRLFAPLIKAQQTFFGQLMFVPNRRGQFEMTRLRFLTQFPFGLLEKWWRTESVSPIRKMFITPRILPLDFPVHLSAAIREEALMTTERRGDGHTFSGIRDFNPSDNPRRIHWRSTAKRRSLDLDERPQWLVKEMEMEGAPRVRLLWDLPKDQNKLREEEAELFIQVTASLIDCFSRRNILCSLSLNEGKQVNTDALLEFLSVIEFDRLKESEFLESSDVPTDSPVVDVWSVFESWRSKRDR